MSVTIHELDLPRDWSEDAAVRAAYTALSGYTEATGSDTSLRRGVETVQLLGDFLPDISPTVAAVTLMSDLAFRGHEPTRATPAKIAIKNFSRIIGPESPQWMYVSSVLPDMVYTDEQSKGRQTLISGNQRTLSVLDSRVQGTWVPPMLWSERIGFASPRFMGEIVSNVNSESFPLNALRNAAKFRIGDPENPRSIYRTIYAGEALIAPITEIMRLDALAAYVRSLGRVARLQQIGGEAAMCVDRADSIQKKYQSSDEEFVRGLMNDALRIFFGDHAHGRYVVEDTTDHGMRFGEFVAALPDFEFRGLLRAKPKGNIALKYYEDGYEPIDIYGMTFVVANESQIAKTYAHVIRTVKEYSGIKFISSQSRPGKPFKVQGEVAYRNAILGNNGVRDALGDLYPKSIEDKDDPGGYRVAKLTIAIRKTIKGNAVWVPCEIQIMTEDDRQRNQTGETSHAIREAKKSGFDVDIDPQVLEEISLRRDTKMMGTFLWPASMPRGARYRNMIARLSDPGANPRAFGKPRK